MTRMHAGFTGVVQNDWPRPRGWVPPHRLDALDVATLPGVGATLAKRLRTFGIESVRDLLFHAPRRYESAVDDVPICEARSGRGRGGDRRSNRERTFDAPLPGRRTIVTAVVRDDAGQISASFFNQPWLLEKLTPGTPLRLRGKLGQYGFDVKSYDIGEARSDRRLRAGVSGERADPLDAPARARARRARPARAQLSRSAAG